jgi:sulfite dehydrogenase (cytochrome) subunit B
MKKSKFAMLILGACFACAPLVTAAPPIAYQEPEESSKLKPGPNMKIAEASCGACHSYDYITTQPRGPGFGRDFWQAEVTKMIKVYGAPIGEADAAAIVEYLANTY